MFETLAINFRDQGQGGPPWDEPAGGGMGEDDSKSWNGQGKGSPPWNDDSNTTDELDDSPYDEITDSPCGEIVPGQPVPPEVAEFFDLEEEPPIQVRASELELLYAHLQIVTDFEDGFIEEMLEFDPNEEERDRINQLRKKRMELRQMEYPNQNPFGQIGGMPPQGMPPQGNGGITTILV